ncbi:MAG: hypothetical protein IJY05_03185 [Clostridia bacterium]|nr:hypothetical protein [Clostridia bacterium]
MIQFDYPSSGIGKKDRKRYTFSDFRGVDKSVAEINVAPTRAVESTNFVDRNGVLHKRYGWEQVYQFEGEINGFWELYLDGVNYTICYAGEIFYRKTENGWKEAYKSDKLVSRRTACYTQNKKAYFIGCGDFLVFRFDNEIGKYAFFRVYDDAETYIPTTTAQISPTDMVLEGIGEQYARDSVNLLTGWRKNTLVGVAVPSENTEGLYYALDSCIGKNSSFCAELEISSKIYKLAYESDTEITVEENEDLSSCSFSLNGASGSITNYNYFPALNAEVESGEYFDWKLQIEGEGGVSCGLRWKKEAESSLKKKFSYPNYEYNVYTLYLHNEDKSKEIPILRDYHRKAYDKNTDLNESEYGLSVDMNDEGGLSLTAIKNYEDHLSLTFWMYVYVNVLDEYGNSVQYAFRPMMIRAGYMESTQTIDTSDMFALGYTSPKIARIDYPTKVEHIPTRRSRDWAVEEEYDINLPEIQDYSDSFASFFNSEVLTLKFIDSGIYDILTITADCLKYEDEELSVELQMTGYLNVKKWNIAEDEKKNISVKFYADNPLEAESILNTKYSTLYGVASEANRLFVANGDKADKSNVIFFSEMDDFTYFPDTFTKAVGGNANEVKGFIRLANGSMAALKSLNGNEPTVFVFNGEYISGYYDAEETEPYTLPKFSTSGVSTTQGIIAPYACSNLADDSLFLSQNGVYALELSQGTDSQRFAKERSLPINNLLKECNLSELEEACAITHENKYYLAVLHYKRTTDTSVVAGKTYYERVGGSYVKVEKPDEDTGMFKYYEREECVYVADAHYTFKPMGDMADTFSYEWYPLTNIPVRIWFLLNGELYFGTNDGRVCRFVENQYYDVKKIYLASNVESGEIKAYSQQQVKAITTVLDTNADGNIVTFSIAKDTEIADGDTIIFTSGTLLGIVKEDVYEELRVEVKDLLNTELYIVKCKNENDEFEGNIQLKYTPDGEVVEFVKAENLTATIQKKTVVKASRTMPTFDFGMPDYLKTLESFTVTMNGVDGGYALLDISTRNNRSFAQNVKGQSRYDTLNGFSQTSFNVPFQNSFTKKIMIRNFNYAIFKINNDMPVDCSVSSISVMYKYNRASGGIK